MCPVVGADSAGLPHRLPPRSTRQRRPCHGGALIKLHNQAGSSPPCYSTLCTGSSYGCFGGACRVVERRATMFHLVELPSIPLVNAATTLFHRVGLAQKNMSQRHRLRLHTVVQDRPSASHSLPMSIHTVETSSLLARNWYWPRSPKVGGERRSRKAACDIVVLRKQPTSFGVACVGTRPSWDFDFHPDGSKITTPYSARLGISRRRRHSKILRVN